MFSGVADLRKVFDRRSSCAPPDGSTLLFVDEIHRFNRAQQDTFLPYVEDGTVILVGATTENPSLRAQRRAAVTLSGVVLNASTTRAGHLLHARRPYGSFAAPDDDARQALVAMADGDGRYVLTLPRSCLP